MPASTAGRPATVVSEITTADALARLEGEWGALLEASAVPTIFLTWEWLSTWWKRLGGARRLSVIAVRRADELIALAPLSVVEPEMTRLSPFPALEFLGTGSVGSDYLDLVIARGREDEAIDALADHLARRGLPLRLGQLRRSSSSAAALAARLVSRRWLAVERPGDVCPFITLEGRTWEAYLASLDGHHRSNFRRRLKAFENVLEMRVERARTPAECRGALATLFTLHGRRWTDRGGSTAFHSAALRAFHEEWAVLALARGWLRLYVMRMGAMPVAALYAFRHGEAFSFYQIGFDPDCARYGPGQVLVGLAIKVAFEEGARVFDFLHGDERYKFDWARDAAGLTRIELYPPGWRGRIHRDLAQLNRAARRAARRWLVRPAAGDPINGRTGGGDRVQSPRHR